MDATPRVMEAQQVSPLTKKPYAYGLPSPLIASKGFAPSHAAAMRESTHFEAELPYFSSAIARSAADTQAFAAELSGLTPLHAHKPPKGKGQELCSRYMDIFVRLGVHPSTEEEMVALEEFLAECEGLLRDLNSELNEARKSLRFLTEQEVGFETDQLQIIGDTWCWPSKVKPKVAECNKRLKAERNRAEEELTMKKERFIEELDEYVRQAEACKEWGDISRVSENCLAISTLQGKITEAKERAEGINGEEELLGQPRSVFDQITQVSTAGPAGG